MKLLILTQYFPPEIGAPQNRLYELAVRLQKQGVDVTVLTAMPNYPQMEVQEPYRGKFYACEEKDGLKIHRAYIYVSRSKSIVARLINYFSFVFTSLWIGTFKLGRFDYVFCESPPLFLGISAYCLKKLKRAGLIFNVSDLWPESAEKLGLVTNRLLLGLSTRLEEFLYRKSVLITGQTQGIVKNISQRFPGKKVYWLPNGVDMNYYRPVSVESAWRSGMGFAEDDLLTFYGGIIGHAQGLDVILKAAAQLKEQGKIKFILLGSGPEKERLMQMKQEQGLDSVVFLDALPKDKIPAVLKAIDIAIIPLKKLDLFKGAIPSKIFESLAMEKPVLLGVDGEARELFVEQGRCAVYFEPENHLDLAVQLQSLYQDPARRQELGKNGRQYVETSFNRDIIAKALYAELINIDGTHQLYPKPGPVL